MPRESTADINALVALFYDDGNELGSFEEIDPANMPPVYQKLLAHEAHMTVTVESFHGSPVDVEVKRTSEHEEHYSREILLRRRTDHAVVQYGIVRLNRTYLDPQVRSEIESQRVPLGRVLISHNVLRKVQLLSTWKVAAGKSLAAYFNVDERTQVYGRTALIYCNGEPAVELLEIVTPAD